MQEGRLYILCRIRKVDMATCHCVINANKQDIIMRIGIMQKFYDVTIAVTQCIASCKLDVL